MAFEWRHSSRVEGPLVYALYHFVLCQTILAVARSFLFNEAALWLFFFSSPLCAILKRNKVEVVESFFFPPNYSNSDIILKSQETKGGRTGNEHWQMISLALYQACNMGIEEQTLLVSLRHSLGKEITICRKGREDKFTYRNQ